MNEKFVGLGASSLVAPCLGPKLDHSGITQNPSFLFGEVAHAGTSFPCADTVEPVSTQWRSFDKLVDVRTLYYRLMLY